VQVLTWAVIGGFCLLAFWVPGWIIERAQVEKAGV